MVNILALPPTTPHPISNVRMAENGTEVIIEGLKRNYFNKAITSRTKKDNPLTFISRLLMNLIGKIQVIVT